MRSIHTIMLDRFGAFGSDLFSTTFRRIFIDAQPPEYYEDFKSEPLGGGTPAAIEILHALGESDDDELKDFFSTLENGIKDELWIMSDDQLLDVLKTVAPYLIHRTIRFVGEIPLKKLQRLPDSVLSVIAKDMAVMQMASIGIQRQAAETNTQYFKSLIKEPIQMVLKGESAQDRMEGSKQLADIVGSSETIFRSLSTVCSLQYVQSKSLRWAVAFLNIVTKIKSNQVDLPRYRDLFDLASEVNTCVRKKAITPSSLAIVRKQLEKMIRQQASTEERDYRVKVEDYNRKYGLTEGIKDQLIALWRQLKNKDTSNIFAEPVTEAIAPNYFSIIKSPMDLRTILNKINNGSYQTKEDMCRDVTLMLQNCMIYNKGNQFSNYAVDLRAKWDYILRSAPGGKAAAPLRPKLGAAGPAAEKPARVDVLPAKVVNRTQEAAKRKAREAPKPRKVDRYDSDDASDDGSDEDDGDAEVIAQGRSMLKKPPAAKAKDSDDDEDDDSYVGPARSRPVRSVKKRRIVNDDSDEDDDEGTGPRYAQNGDGGSSDEEVFQPTTPLEKKMLKLWNFVDRSDSRHFFLNRVTDEIAPNYSQVVRSPMYLNLIKAKLGKREYPDLNAFHKDINLIFSNCILYNGEESELGKVAVQLREKYRKFVEKEEAPPAPRAIASKTPGSASKALAPLQIPKGDAARAQAGGGFSAFLSLLWRKLVDLDESSIFLNEVTDDIAKGYSKEIAKPMYLTLMKKKIARGEYKTVESFNGDVDLIVDNCIQFNGEDDDLAILAEEFKEKYYEYFENDPVVQERVTAIKNGTIAETPSASISRQTSNDAKGDALQDVLLEIWTQLVAFDTGAIFYEKVTNKMAPNYSNMIRRPMYLTLVKEKILRGEYRRVEDFSADIKLILDNCKKYNGPESEYTKTARDLFNLYLSLAKTVPKGLSSSTPRTVTSNITPASAAAVSTAAAATAAPVLEETEQSILSRIKDAWLIVHDKDVDRVFLEPVSEQFAPNYSKEIKRPICLSDMRAKAKAKQYATFAQFVDDVRLMFANCVQYNGKGSTMAIYGQNLLREFEQHVAASKPEYKKAPPAPKAAVAVVVEPVVSSGGPDAKMIKTCILEAIATLREVDTERIFENKVSLPGYSRVVKKQMYVKMMEDKAKSGAYRTFEDFHADVILMFDNCNAFNKGNQGVLAYADHVKRGYDATKAQLMQTKLKVTTVEAAPVASAKVSAAVTPAATSAVDAAKKFPPRPDVSDLLSLDLPILQQLKSRLDRETYVQTAQILAFAQRAAHARQFTVLELRSLHKIFVDEILQPLYGYAALVPIDSADEALLIKTYIPAATSFVTKLKTLRPEDAMFGMTITKLNEVLTVAVDFLVKCDGPTKLFREVPTDAIAPEYSKLIKYPMAISLLREKIKHNAYRNIDDFHEDVVYIAKNCLDYNGLESPVSKQVVEFIVRWYVFYGFMLHMYPFLSQATKRSSLEANGDGPSPNVIRKKKRALSSDDESDNEHAPAIAVGNGRSNDEHAGGAASVIASSPPTKKPKREEDIYLSEVNQLLDLAAVGEDAQKNALAYGVTVTAEDWDKFAEKLLTREKAITAPKLSKGYLSKLIPDLVAFLRVHDVKKLFTRPMPQAKEINKTELMDFAAMLVKNDRSLYLSAEDLLVDLKKIIRNRLITERFNANDAQNTNEQSVYALGTYYFIRCAFAVFEGVIGGRIASPSDAKQHFPKLSGTASPAESAGNGAAIDALGPRLSSVGIPAAPGDAKPAVPGGMPSPPKIRRQISEDGEVLSDDEQPTASAPSAVAPVAPLPEPLSHPVTAPAVVVAAGGEDGEEADEVKEEPGDTSTAMDVDEEAVSDAVKPVETAAVEAAAASKSAVMMLDAEDEVKEEFVALPPAEGAVAPLPEADSKEVVVEQPTVPAAEAPVAEIAPAKEAENMAQEMAVPSPVAEVAPSKETEHVAQEMAVPSKPFNPFATEAFDSDNDEPAPAAPEAAPVPATVSTVGIAPPLPQPATDAPPQKSDQASIQKKEIRKSASTSIFQTEAFESSDEETGNNRADESEDEEFRPTMVHKPVPTLPVNPSASAARIRKKVRADSSDEEDNGRPNETPAVAVAAAAAPATAPVVAPKASDLPPRPPALSSPAASDEKNGLRPIQSIGSNLQSVGSSGGRASSTAMVGAGTPSPPQPSEALVSSRRAVEYLQGLASLTSQIMQGQRDGFRSSDSPDNEPLLSLPSLVTNPTTRCAALILKHNIFQQLLLPLLAREVIDVVVKSRSEKATLLHKNQRVLLVAQLCVISISNDLHLYGLDGDEENSGLVAVLLREWVPWMLCSILDKTVPEFPEEKLVTAYFTSSSPAPKVEGQAAKETSTGADKERTVKFLRELRGHLATSWSDSFKSLDL